MTTNTDARVPWGLRDGQIVHISEVGTTGRGLACACTCPHCHDRLQAKLGDSRVHHFSHVSDRSCDGNRETALHALAKEILAAHKELMVPAAVIYWEDEDMELFKAQYLPYETARLEERLDSLRPDLILDRSDDKLPLLIEVAVTHFVDEEKLSRLKALGRPCIEINLLSTGLDFHEFDRAELERIIVHESCRKQWLCIPGEDTYIAQLEEQARKREERALEAARLKAEQAEQALNARRRKVERILSTEHQDIAAARRNGPFADQEMWPYLRERLHIKDEGNIPHYLNHQVAGEHLFNCNRVIWQSSVFLSWVYRKRLPGREPDIAVWHVADNFMERHRDLLECDLVYAKGDVYEGPRLQDVFSEYFSFLERCGFVEAAWGRGKGTRVFKCVRPEVIIIPAEYNNSRYLPDARGLFDTETGRVIPL